MGPLPRLPERKARSRKVNSSYFGPDRTLGRLSILRLGMVSNISHFGTRWTDSPATSRSRKSLRGNRVHSPYSPGRICLTRPIACFTFYVVLSTRNVGIRPSLTGRGCVKTLGEYGSGQKVIKNCAPSLILSHLLCKTSSDFAYGRPTFGRLKSFHTASAKSGRFKLSMATKMMLLPQLRIDQALQGGTKATKR